MSLDERTLEWLKGRSDADYPGPCRRIGKRGLFSMHYCLKACDGNRAASPEYCPLASDFRDAAEFEARVAAKLAENTLPLPCGSRRCPHEMPFETYCRPCRIKYTRLAVEEEMKKEEE